jgi:hypothetical protein
MSGAWTIARWRGIPLRLHWSVLVAVWAVCGFSFRPLACLAVLALIVVHEIGHAVVVRLCGAYVSQILLAGFGGSCSWGGNISPTRRALIAWGGIFGQAVLFGVALIFPRSLGAEFFVVWTRYNLILAVLNLLPVEPPWRIFPVLWGLRRRRQLKSKLRSLQRELDAVRKSEFLN